MGLKDVTSVYRTLALFDRGCSPVHEWIPLMSIVLKFTLTLRDEIPEYVIQLVRPLKHMIRRHFVVAGLNLAPYVVLIQVYYELCVTVHLHLCTNLKFKVKARSY